MDKTLTYALLVFLAGSSYGFLVPVIKVAESAGVHVADFLPLQYLLAFFIMGAVTVARRIPFATPREFVTLAAVGLFTSCTSLCYYRAVAMLPSAVALTLLFQFVWIGVVLDAVATRKLPDRTTLIAVVIVLLGTAFAAGLFDMSIASLDPMGIAFGLGSALFYALFLFSSGRVGTEFAVPLRTMGLSFGGFVMTTLMNPGFVFVAMTDALIWPCALLLAFLGIIIPTGLIAFASPKLESGVVTIMASSELPVGVLAAWLIVSDTPSLLTLFGVALVLVGIVYNQWPALRAAYKKK
ncbi:MAG: DMT family transporter [Eggerthellaceae bacterium]|nr:DMT family transporter [Eggerthellaceae bacterium]